MYVIPFCESLERHAHTLQHIATHCNTLQHTATHCNTLLHTATHCNTLQHTATHCNTLQHTATHCNILYHTATHCTHTNAHTHNPHVHTCTHTSTLSHTPAHIYTADLHMRVCCSKLMMFSVRVDLLNIALFTHPASLTFLCLYALVLCAPLQVCVCV